MSRAKSELRFECTGCGECCTNRGEYAYVYVGDREARALGKLLDLSLREFEKRYTFIDEDGWSQLKMDEGRCIFLDPATKRCNAYGARPVQCRTFPFWRNMVDRGRWTDEARNLCEGIGRGRLYSIEEAEDRMVEMEESDLDD